MALRPQPTEIDCESCSLSSYQPAVFPGQPLSQENCQAVLHCAHRRLLILLNDLSKLAADLPWKGIHVSLRAAVERGPSEGARSGSTGDHQAPSPLLLPCVFPTPYSPSRVGWSVLYCARRTIEMVPPSLLVVSQGWGLIDLLLRAFNEGLLRPRVARAKKVISPHPPSCSSLLQPVH